LFSCTDFFITEAPLCGFLVFFFCQLGACVGKSKSCTICSSGTKRLLQTTFEEHFKIWQKTGLRNIMYSLEVIAGFVV
jgi:hypothetical protein